MAKMIAFAFSFPTGRYHATPWGRHANEADVSWPPEPIRILRALVATWWRKGDHSVFPKPVLDGLIDTLASELPVFHLPAAVHAHVSTFMPAPRDKKLIYDGFLRFDQNAELVAAWIDVNLSAEQTDLSAHLLERMGYLGRAESWAEARITNHWDGEVNACPRTALEPPSSGAVPGTVAVPLTPAQWAELRQGQIAGLTRMTKARRRAIEATLPQRLSDALAVDTSDWQRCGWSSPPPLRMVTYDRPRVEPRAPTRRPRNTANLGQPGTPEVARFLLAGRPLPRVEDTLRIGEIARWALMSGEGIPPQEFSGRNETGPQRDDPAHAHAFFLPEDADGDGCIDHLIVYCRRGFSDVGRQRLSRLRYLWLTHGRINEEGERGRKEWRVALEDIAAPEGFGDSSALLRRSMTWASVTPYLMPWHAKRNFGVVEQIKQELERRLTAVPLVSVKISDDRSKRAIKFKRTRARRGLSQPDTIGTFLSLRFSDFIAGPVSLGFACHYGLGLFAAAPEDVCAD